MTGWAARGVMILGALVLAVSPLTAHARSIRRAHHIGHRAVPSAHYRSRTHRYIHYAGISCVPFARAESGIILTGNAANWWNEADGRYARGTAPEAGSVLNFRANYAMRLGHVAVVRSVVNSRQIEIDQANWWGPGGGHGVISRDVAVIDVSPHNDWSAVRVALGHSGSFGSVYPTYGFIYDRPEGSASSADVSLASADGTGVLNPAPRDLRPRGQRSRLAEVHPVRPDQYDEVAEAPPVSATGPVATNGPDQHAR